MNIPPAGTLVEAIMVGAEFLVTGNIEDPVPRRGMVTIRKGGMLKVYVYADTVRRVMGSKEAST
jgi:hypothetical protein